MILADADHPNYTAFYKDETIDLTGKSWLNCVFIDCTLQLTTYDSKYIVYGTYIENCKLIGDGWYDYSIDMRRNSPNEF